MKEKILEYIAKGYSLAETSMALNIDTTMIGRVMQQQAEKIKQLEERLKEAEK